MFRRRYTIKNVATSALLQLYSSRKLDTFNELKCRRQNFDDGSSLTRSRLENQNCIFGMLVEELSLMFLEQQEPGRTHLSKQIVRTATERVSSGVGNRRLVIELNTVFQEQLQSTKRKRKIREGSQCAAALTFGAVADPRQCHWSATALKTCVTTENLLSAFLSDRFRMFDEAKSQVDP